MKTKKLLALSSALLVLLSTGSQAGVVTVWGERYNLNTINDFYNGLSGHSSSIAGGTLDTVGLGSTDLLWAVQPANDYTAAELNTMAGFLSVGGRIAFMGEHGTYAPAENTRINSALSFLSSTISIDNVVLDGGFRSASVVDGQILTHDLTAGVAAYEYAAFAPLILGAGAEALMLGEEQYLGTDSIMMAYQNIGPGSIFLITDQNVWDNSPTWGGTFDNATMFENLLAANTGAPPVNGIPTPGTLALLGLGVLGFSFTRRKKVS